MAAVRLNRVICFDGARLSNAGHGRAVWTPPLIERPERRGIGRRHPGARTRGARISSRRLHHLRTAARTAVSGSRRDARDPAGTGICRPVQRWTVPGTPAWRAAVGRWGAEGGPRSLGAAEREPSDRRVSREGCRSGTCARDPDGSGCSVTGAATYLRIRVRIRLRLCRPRPAGCRSVAGKRRAAGTRADGLSSVGQPGPRRRTAPLTARSTRRRPPARRTGLRSVRSDTLLVVPTDAAR
jgi:hypothetical protein